ncbi:hypothetical protein [Sporosarcina sp. ANT_H38]|uniref:hypothetical protein n=1 Tax=Sporosarcina sp. ANT_H38 TaxID=2597358 RepID=UPI00165E302F|nr:hypothetical protein [Sporosarcina sp. ANT_H38]
MSRSNKTDSDLLAGLLRKAITKRQSVVGRTFYLLSVAYIVGRNVFELYSTKEDS